MSRKLQETIKPIIFGVQFQSHTRSGDVATLDAKISARIRYGNLAHVSDSCRQKHCIPNCGQKAADKDMVTFNSL